MTIENKLKLPINFWIIAALAVMWNIIGFSKFVASLNMSPEQLAALPEAHRQLLETLPTWFYIVFGGAVITGLLGSALLLLRKKLALPFLGLSLIFVTIQLISGFLFNTYNILGKEELYIMISVVFFAAFLLFYSRSSAAKGWLR